MSELPENWIDIELEALNQFSSKNINPAYFPDETFELYSVPTFPEKKPEIILGSEIGSSKQVVSENDILVCKINPRINRVWQVKKSSGLRQIASSEWIVVRAPKLIASYLRHYFSSYGFREAFCQNLTGVGGSLTRAQPKRVAKLPLPLAPLNEQKRIADKLDALLAAVDACRACLDKVPALIKRFRQSVLAAATSGALTDDWRNVGKQDQSNTWKSVQLGDAADSLSYGTSNKSTSTGTIPVLRMGNIQNGKLDWDSLVFTSDADEIEKYCLASGDVLFNRTNSPELVGKTAVYHGERSAIYAGYLIRIKCSKKLLPDFLSYCLNSPYGRDYCWQVKSDGVSQSNINAKKLAALPIELPPVAEQREIVRRVEALFAIADKLETRLAAARKRVDRLTPAILAQAFRGELVAQDPNDEPASALLAKIGKPVAAKRTIKEAA